MADMHLTMELLHAAAGNEIPPQVLATLVLDHLLEVCPHCRQELAAFWRQQRRPSEYSQIWHVLRQRIERQGPEIERQKRRAERWLAELKALPLEERLERIRRSRTRYRGRPLVQLLLDESRRELPDNLETSYELARTAGTILIASGQCTELPDLWALAMAYEANAFRASGDLRQADERFRQVRHLVMDVGVTDTLVCAELEALEGSLRKDQRRLEEAVQLLQRSVLLYRVVEEPVQEARVLLKLGATYNLQGDPHQAADVTHAALQALNPAEHACLYLYARYNLAHYFHSAGDQLAARDVLLVDANLYEGADRWMQKHRTWLEGKIHAAEDEPDEAEAAFLEVRNYFVERQVGFDVAAVSLDLCLLYLKQGRLPEVQRIAAETVELFAAQEVHREALSALILYRDAAVSQRASATMVRRLARYLTQARHDPDHRFKALS